MMQIKKMYAWLGLLLLALVVVIKLSSNQMESNEDTTTINYSKFPKEFTLTGKDFAIDDELMRYPYRIRQRGDYVYVLDLHGSENSNSNLFVTYILKPMPPFLFQSNSLPIVIVLLLTIVLPRCSYKEPRPILEQMLATRY